MNLQEFIENNLPNYSSREDVARYLDLDMYLSGQAYGTSFANNMDAKDIDTVFNEFIQLQDKLFLEAMDNYNKTLYLEMTNAINEI